MSGSKYYLLKHTLYASIGGYVEDLDIIDISYDRETLVELIRDILDDDNITEINDMGVDEFEFNENDFKWTIEYKRYGMCMRDTVLYKILERIEQKMAKKTITSLLEKIETEVNKSYAGVEEYAATLEDTGVITNHLDKIGNLIEQVKEMI